LQIVNYANTPEYSGYFLHSRPEWVKQARRLSECAYATANN